ncbi:hypothetical protein LEMLEM_LOCUS1176 [Lemmus lemmus]
MVPAGTSKTISWSIQPRAHAQCVGGSWPPRVHCGTT